MAELLARTPAEGLLPLEIGQARVEEVDLGVLTSLSPFGDASALSAALREAHDLDLPAPNRATGKEGARCIWFGRNEVLLAGPVPDAALGAQGAVVDQSDGWSAVRLSGAASEEVLARLVPVDFRAGHFKRGHTVRCQVMHMAASVTRVGAESFLILVFRSMAGTLVHDLRVAMAATAARG